MPTRASELAVRGPKQGALHEQLALDPITQPGRARAQSALQEGDRSVGGECSDDRCTELVAVPRAVYEEVRANARRFLVVPGHDQDFEDVVERTERYAIVEKEGRAGEVAEQTDPRG